MAARSTISLGIEVTGGEAFKAALKACDAETRALNTELQRLSTSQASADRGLSGMAQKYNLLSQSVEQGKAKLALLSTELEKGKQKLADLATALDRAKQSGDATAIAQATTAYERQRTVVAGLEQNYSATRQQVDQATNAMRQLTSGAISAGLEKLKTVSANIAHGFAEMGKAAVQAAHEITSRMQTAVTGLTAAGAALVVGLGKIGVQYNSQIENYVTNFSTLLGGTENAVKKVEELKKMAAATPFGMQDLAQATQTLLSFGIAADQTTPILKMLGDVSLGNRDRFQALTLAFAQVSSAGKLTGQDLMQMINAGFNPLQEISKMTGESMESLKDRMSRGAISAEEVAKAFEHATKEGGQFYNGMQNASQTMTGLFSTLKDNAKALVGQVFEPVSNSIKTTLLPAALQYIQQLTDAFTKDGLPGLINAVGDCLDQIVAKIGTEGPTIIQRAVEIITQIAQRLTQSLPEMVRVGRELISSIMDGLQQTLPQLGPIAAQIAPLVAETIIRYKSELLNAGIMIITQILEGIAKNAPDIVKTIVDCMDQLINTIITSLPQILNAATDIIMAIVDGLLNNMDKVVNAITDVITSCIDWITSNLDKFLDAALEIIMSLAMGIINNIDKVVDAIIKCVEALINWVLDNLDKIIKCAGELIIAFGKGIGENEAKVIDAITRVVTAMLDWVINNLDKVVDTALELVITLAKTLVDNYDKVINAIMTLITEMLKWITDNIDKVIETAVKIVMAIVDGLLKAIPDLLKGVAKIVENILTGLAEAVKKVPEIGANIVKGVWEGIQNFAGWLGEKVTGFFGGIITDVKNFLGIHSPSRVFAVIGENIGLGLAEGIMGSAKVVQAAMDYITPSAGNITMGIDAASVAGRVAADNGGVMPWQDNRPIILTLNDRELGRAVRGYA